jgi:small subunit ribosomal protein S17
MPRRVLKGIIAGVNGNNTVSVKVERTFSYPLYKKTVKRSNKYSVHCIGKKYLVGDRVKIIECRPISKTKSWMVLE